MVSYNKGRFKFLFDSGNKKLFSIYDTKYDKPYTINNYEFATVFGVAIETLDNDALEELMKKLGYDPKYKIAVSNLLESRK